MGRMKRSEISSLVVAYLTGLAHEGVVFVKLKPDGKQPTRGYDHFKVLHERDGRPEKRLSRALSWLQQGYGIGFLVGQSGLWVIDADDQQAVELVNEIVADHRINCPVVGTPGGGRHYIMRLPGDFNVGALKCHARPRDLSENRRSWDFKLQGNTLLAAAGTRRGERNYEPVTSWTDPPGVHPGAFALVEDLFRDPRPWAPAPGDEKRRRGRAWIFLRDHARTSMSGKGGHRTLLWVCTQLTQFYGLPVGLAFAFLTRTQSRKPSWNDRCVDHDGKTFYPWSQRELFHSLEESLNLVPEAGVRELARQQREAWVEACFLGFTRMVTGSSGEGAGAWIDDLHRCFEAWVGLEVSVTLFGRALTKFGLRRTRAWSGGRKLRFLPGVDLGLLHHLLLRQAPPIPPS